MRPFGRTELALLSSLGLAVASGCTTAYVDFSDCTPEELAQYGCAYCPVTCKEQPDAGAEAATACDGLCVPLSPLEWSEAVLLWYGPEDEMPTCPSWAPIAATNYHADLIEAPHATCGACSCSPPAGVCALPATVTASSTICPGDGSSVTHTSSDPPPNWSGACTASDAIPAGALCNGTPCVESITIAPLVLSESGCSPSVAPSPAKQPPDLAIWSTSALVCKGKPSGLCVDPGETCAPAVPEASGFRVCIGGSGDLTCPGSFPEKHLFFDHVDDDRTCSPCACGAATGSSCAGSISFFTDANCSTPLPLTLPLDAASTKCHDVSSGSALASKAAGPVKYTPGTCPPSGGEPLGSIVPAGPSTYCCRP